MAGGCNKFSFVDPGHIFGWNLMKLGMGPLFDIVYLQKWSNSVRRTVRRPFFFTFWAIWSRFAKKKFWENFHPKKLRDLSREHLSPLTDRNETIISSR